MSYVVAEKFKSLQGEGVYTGTPMAFIRFVGCSVGKRICQHCDTDFDKTLPWRGGGEFTENQLLDWAHPYDYICLTGGEPLDQALAPLVCLSQDIGHRTNNPWKIHIETSGTQDIDFRLKHYRRSLWICVSPKPGFKEDVVMGADEIKVIVPGLGEMTSAMVDAHIIKLHQPGYQCGPGEFEDYAKKLRWPTLEDALRWANMGKTVFLQPRNAKHDVDYVNLRYVQDIIAEYPKLRLSLQTHKLLKVQ